MWSACSRVRMVSHVSNGLAIVENEKNFSVFLKRAGAKLEKGGHVSSESKESEVITWKSARKSRSFAIRLILPPTAPFTFYYVTSSWQQTVFKVIPYSCFFISHSTTLEQSRSTFPAWWRLFKNLPYKPYLIQHWWPEPSWCLGTRLPNNLKPETMKNNETGSANNIASTSRMCTKKFVLSKHGFRAQRFTRAMLRF